MVSEKEYNKVIKLIVSIGYEKRDDTRYDILEDDGSIFIDHSNYDSENTYIVFHKTHFFHLSKDSILKLFNDYESFEKFIFEYHTKLFLKQKLTKMMNNITDGF